MNDNIPSEPPPSLSMTLLTLTGVIGLIGLGCLLLLILRT